MASQSVDEGEYASKPANPIRNSNTFAGGYTDAACTKTYSFDETVTGSITLYAKWTENDSEKAISDTDVSLSQTIYTNDGTEKKQEVTVK